MFALRRTLLSPGTKLPSQRLLARTFFINTEITPNANSLKFLPGREVLPESFGTGMFFQRHDHREVSKSPLVKLILAEEGVKSVFLGRDFITVTKEQEENWNTLRPNIFSVLFDFFSTDRAVIESNPSTVMDTTILDDDSEVVQAIKELIETRVRPSVQEDGGDIFYHGFDVETGNKKGLLFFLLDIQGG